LVEETSVPGENYRPVASHGQTVSQNVVSSAINEVRTHYYYDMHEFEKFNHITIIQI
jgi:hypothetical protein